MTAAELLRELDKARAETFSALAGYVHFGPTSIFVGGVLADGAHRLDGEPWQFIVSDGHAVAGVREDMRSHWREDYEVHADKPPEKPAAKTGNGRKLG